MQEKSGDLPIGKLSPNLLSYLLSTIRPVMHAETRQGPGIGEDAAIIRLPCCDLAIHTDPITEAASRIGWLSLHVAANDVATTGACPKWASITVLFPKGTDTKRLEETILGIRKAAEQLNIDIVGGHTEISPGIHKPIVVSTVLGITCSGCAIRTGDAREGDVVVFAGYAGAEGTGIIALDFPELLKKCGMKLESIKEAIRLGSAISIVKPACRLARNKLATSMHDVTEGGAIGALVEVAIATGKRMKIYADKIPVHPVTRHIAKCLRIDPLRLIGSGSFIVTTPSDMVDRVIEILTSMNIKAEVIGIVEEGEPSVSLIRNGKLEVVREAPVDAISEVWERYGKEKS